MEKGKIQPKDGGTIQARQRVKFVVKNNPFAMLEDMELEKEEKSIDEGNDGRMGSKDEVMREVVVVYPMKTTVEEAKKKKVEMEAVVPRPVKEEVADEEEEEELVEEIGVDEEPSREEQFKAVNCEKARNCEMVVNG